MLYYRSRSREQEAAWEPGELLQRKDSYSAKTTVALSGNGTLLAMGNCGNVRLFEKGTAPFWQQKVTIPFYNSCTDNSITLSSDGETLLITGSQVQLFVKVGAEWRQSGFPVIEDCRKVTRSTCAFSGEAWTFALGAPDNEGGIGACWVGGGLE